MDPSERYVPDTGTDLQRVLAAAEVHEATLLLDEAEAEDPPAQPSTSGP